LCLQASFAFSSELVFGHLYPALLCVYVFGRAFPQIADFPIFHAGLNTKILATTDPDGWKVVFVDEADFLAEL